MTTTANKMKSYSSKQLLSILDKKKMTDTKLL